MSPETVGLFPFTMLSPQSPAKGTSARWGLFRAGVLGVLGALVLSLTPAAEMLEWQARDVLLRMRGPRQTKAKTVVIALDDATLEAWPEPMLFWGPRYAALIERVRGAGAKWIGLDVIPTLSADDWLSQRFSEAAERPGELPDRQFQQALRGGKVALSYSAERKPAPQFSDLLPLEGNLGFTDVTYPEDSAVRRIRLTRATGQGSELSLVALLARRAQGIEPDSSVSDVSGSAELWVNYLGPPGSIRTLSAERVAAGDLNAEERAALREAVVLIGPTFSGSNDLHLGPGGSWYSGVEIQAHAVATLIDERPLRIPAPVPAAVALFFGGLLLAVVGSRLDSFLKAAVFGALGVGWAAAALTAARSDLLLPLIGPLGVVVLVPLAQRLWLAREESRRRRRVEALFGQHVSETVAKRLLEGPPVPADGERRTVTVLFADIRGFTALSDKAPPEQVVRLLNETLTALSECILASEGTLDKYVGDCVMAFWNAPSEQPDHAARAIRAALAMQPAVERLNERLSAQGLPEISVRVGINTGEAVVGSIGSPALRDYTVIGNTVNLASRLESANKEVGTSILVGEAAFASAGEIGVAAKEHALAIRGVEAVVIAYSLEGKARRSDRVSTRDSGGGAG